MATSFSDRVFGTLPKQYCLWFYVLCILSFIIVISALFSIIFLLTKKNVSTSTYIYSIALFINYCFIYLTYRLLYSMCINTLK